MESYEEKKAAADDFTELDKRIIPLFIWTPYLSGNRSEYQEFIWSKISRKVIEDYQPFLRSMKYIISALTPEQLTYSSKKTAQQAEKIASLKLSLIHISIAPPIVFPTGPKASRVSGTMTAMVNIGVNRFLTTRGRYFSKKRST